LSNCTICGETLSWTISNTSIGYWNNQLKHGYIDLLKINRDTKHRIELPNLRGKKLCPNCASDIYFSQQFREALEQGKTQVTVQDLVQNTDGINRRVEMLINIGEKHGYSFKEHTHALIGNSGFGTSAISITMVFEKRTQTQEEIELINCQYY
jgi:hypothetical protein